MRSLIFNALFYSTTLIAASVALVLTFVGGQATLRWFLRRQSLLILWLARVVLNAKIEVRGLERFQNGARPALIVGKHQSELDAFPVLAHYPDLAAIAMMELSRYPLIGPVIRQLGFILVSVEGKKSNQLRQVVLGARRVHAEGRPILIYPEGELMRLGARERYKSGVFHIYESIGCEATPVAVCTGLIWPKREWTKHAGQTGVIEFMEPIPPGLSMEAFMAEIETRLETRTMELIREFGPPDRVAEAERIHALGWTNEDRPVAPSRREKEEARAAKARGGETSTQNT